MTKASTLGELYRLHAAGALRRARQLLASEDQAREAVQQVFLGLVERPDQLAGFSSFAAWMYGAITHLCLNQLRNQRTRERLLAERVEPAALRATAGDADIRLAVQELLARLPDQLTAVAVYYFVDEMTQEEIAELLGCSRRHVGNLVERSRALLERELEEQSA
jgi:RNA polymerase sigma-70 factor (ECF subfamily)